MIDSDEGRYALLGGLDRLSHTALFPSGFTKPRLELHELPKGPTAVTHAAEFKYGGLMYVYGLVMAMMSAFYGEEAVRQRMTGQKDALLQTGVSRRTYWTALFLGHYLLTLIPILITFICWGAYSLDVLTENNVFGCVLLLLLYVPSSILLGYVLSFCFSDILAVQEWMVELLNVLLTLPWLITTFADSSAASTVHTLLGVVPSYALYRGLAVLQAAGKAGRGYDFEHIFAVSGEKTGVFNCLLMLLFDIVWLGALLWAIDSGIIKRLISRPRGLTNGGNGTKEQNTGAVVAAAGGANGLTDLETINVAAEANGENHPMVASDLTKVYSILDQPTKVVDGVSFHIKRGELFSLLGPNGAGKTTLHSMLTGLIPPDAGSATIESHAIAGLHVADWRSKLQAQRRTGVVTQFDDRLFGYLTGEENLKLFGKLRGLKAGWELEGAVAELLKKSGIPKDKAGSLSSKYSGGNKRKLSLALGLVGPDAVTTVVFLDEPTTGLDPKSRRMVG